MPAPTIVLSRRRRAGTRRSSASATAPTSSPCRGGYGPEAATGRGIALVEQLASAWGVDQSTRAKEVWCRIDFPIAADGDERERGDVMTAKLVTREVPQRTRPAHARSQPAPAGDHARVRADPALRRPRASRTSRPGCSRWPNGTGASSRRCRSGARSQWRKRSSAVIRTSTWRSTCRRPPGPPPVELPRTLAEADEFCRRGELLTLATPPEYVAFREWFLGEIVRQLDGQPPDTVARPPTRSSHDRLVPRTDGVGRT